MRKLNVKGFSLVELMVVVAIIGILAAVAIPNFQRFQRKARTAEGRTIMSGLYSSLEAFRAEWEMYTGDFEDIGFSPSGTLRYNVGFAAIGSVPAAPFMTGPTAVFVTMSCGVAPLINCAPHALMPAAAAGAVNPAAGPPATHTIGASGAIGGAVNDDWTLNQNKLMTNTIDGTL